MTEVKTSMVSCPSCKTNYRIQSSNIGKDVVCPKCKTKFNTKPNDKPFELPVIAKLAIAYKFLTTKQVTEALKMFASERKANRNTSFEQILQDLNFLTVKQIDHLNTAKEFLADRVLDKRFGTVAVQKRYASLEDVKWALDTQTQEFNEKKIKRLIGDILLEAGKITKEQRDAVLHEQNRAIPEEPLSEKEVEISGQTDVKEEAAAALNHQKENGADDHHAEDSKEAKESEEGEEHFDFDEAEDLGGEELNGTADEVAADDDIKEELIKDEVIGDKNLSFTISGDRMTAHVTIMAEPPVVYSVQDIKDQLKDRGIRFGIVSDDDIRQYLASGKLKDKFLIAQGRPPQQGENGSVKTYFDTDFLKAGTVDENGNIDYKNRGEIPVVEPGDLIAERIPKRQGKPGVDVFGNRIEPPYVIDYLLRCGRGVKISEDGKQVFAKAKGQPHLSRDGFISILPEYTVEHVNYKSGHVDFDGNVRVLGKIEDDFRLKASGDVIAGEILKAQVEVGGDITVLGGIIGANIKCQGNITAKFIRSATIETYGNITVEKEVMDSRLNISGKALLMRGNIISSTVTTNKGIVAMNVGSFGTKSCTIKFGVDGPVEKRISEMEGIISKVKAELDEYGGSTGDIEKSIIDIDSKLEVFMNARQEIQKKRQPFIKKTMDSSGGSQSASYKRAEIFLKGLNEQLKETDDEIMKLTKERKGLTEKMDEVMAPKNELEQKLEALLFEREQLVRLTNKGGKALPVVRASGQITEGTFISGEHKGTVLKKTLRSSSLREVKKTEADGTVKWRLVVSNK